VDGRSFDDDALATVRRAFAVQMLAIAGVEKDPRLEAAFATVPRHLFLGPAPWRIVAAHGGYHTLRSLDPVVAYQDINFALAPERGVNNGSPTLHARWLHHASLNEGDRVAHIGAGSGYYTALMAHVVGSEGHVFAVEFDKTLAEAARENLAYLENVTVVEGDGADWPQEVVECVYVNFLVQQPAKAWIEHLRRGGRLIFPLGVPRAARSPSGGIHTLYGAGLRIERSTNGFAAKWLGSAYFVCAEGLLAGSAAQGESLRAAFERGGVEFVRSLRWNEPPRPERSWYVGAGWSLAYDEAS
jgi:protein-L-isoaspartate(D-aspartate) O-methyltransferase